ncbi:hypothetical protein Tco_0482631 [Tanacetum coccineum]
MTSTGFIIDDYVRDCKALDVHDLRVGFYAGNHSSIRVLRFGPKSRRTPSVIIRESDNQSGLLLWRQGLSSKRHIDIAPITYSGQDTGNAHVLMLRSLLSNVSPSSGLEQEGRNCRFMRRFDHGLARDKLISSFFSS